MWIPYLASETHQSCTDPFAFPVFSEVTLLILADKICFKIKCAVTFLLASELIYRVAFDTRAQPASRKHRHPQEDPIERAVF